LGLETRQQPTKRWPPCRHLYMAWSIMTRTSPMISRIIATPNSISTQPRMGGARATQSSVSTWEAQNNEPIMLLSAWRSDHDSSFTNKPAESNNTDQHFDLAMGSMWRSLRWPLHLGDSDQGAIDIVKCLEEVPARLKH
jgi:hypothetical protein